MADSASPTTQPLHPDTEETYLTPRKNNCAKRRETHPTTLCDHNESEKDTFPHQLHHSMDANLAANYDDGIPHSTTTHTNGTKGPLSWNEARSSLRSTLEFWNKQQQKRSEAHTTRKSYRFFITENLDMALAVLLCIVFVILSFTLPMHENLPRSFTTMQRIASILFLASSLTSAAIMNRRAKVIERDQSIERRRCVTAFLKEMEVHSDEISLSTRDERNTGAGKDEHHVTAVGDVITRKNVEDVYSTFRYDNTNKVMNNIRYGQWHRIPSLLLVKGDHIALKVGDTCPAKCRLVNGKESSLVISAGERLTIELIGTHLALPPGKSTVKGGELLMLANRVQVFELTETPLDSFLKKDLVVNRKLPQLLRQGHAVRFVLLCLAFIGFIATAAILLIRPSVQPNYFFTSPTWTLPILAGLSFLPVMTPLYLFFLECIGTSRILATVHPFASNQRQRSICDSKPLGGSTKIGGRDSLSTGTFQNNRRGSMLSYLGDTNILDNSDVNNPPPWLILRYLAATVSSRLQSSANSVSESLLTIPPASLYLLEKVGLVTAIALIDDELACEPHSTPQQLLIPSRDGGLKLLDLCPVCNDEDEEYSSDDNDVEQSNGNNYSGRSSLLFRKSTDVVSVDSDDDENEETRFAFSHSAPARSLKRLRKKYSRKLRGVSPSIKDKSPLTHSSMDANEDENEVQFEDPNWWQFLPSLKCIGLTCMLMEGDGAGSKRKTTLGGNAADHQNPNPKVAFDLEAIARGHGSVKSEEAKLLIDHLCMDRERIQLKILARCIGFSTSPNKLGPRGDLSSFRERRRLHIISSELLRKRMHLKSHAMGLEEYRNWSLLYTDADTVFIQDSRSGGDLVLTVGDARVVTELCPDLWSGENSTISPLTASDRQLINETQNNWMLSDLDVQAFSYAPLPYTADHKIGSRNDGEHVYLLDNGQNASAGGFWHLVRNQIFLGLLGSSVRPRKEIEPLIIASADAGVRFVYFSPRNMRRTKELASQMGIDVAWNCAISLRPLEKGEEDSFRMTSNYADWDVNARLPHGVEDVKRHLEEVDNVPLLVSLYTDVTKKTTAEMVNVFQDYNDTVLSVGLSHLPGNHEIFSRADIAIGVDVLSEEIPPHDSSSINENALLSAEVAFIASISAHSSVFNLWGNKATANLLQIIRIGRASLEAATSSATYFLSGVLSYGIFILLCPCTVATVTPIIPALGSFLYIQIVLHVIGLAMASTDGDKEQQTRVPPKNIASVKYSFKENKRWYLGLLLRSSPSSVISHLVYLSALGELLWAFDSAFVEENCAVDYRTYKKPPLSSIIRCQELKHYSGPATTAAGTLALASLALCTCVVSASFVFRTEPISQYPWRHNKHWFGSLLLSIILITAYLVLALESDTVTVLPWYFFVVIIIAPFICLWLSEMVKKADQKQEKRAAMMRRLQFETRLGMWSPKESTHIAEHPMNLKKPEQHSPIV